MKIQRVLLVVLTVVLVVGGISVLKKFKSGELAPDAQPTPEPLVSVFHPDSVLAFQWKTKAKSHSFVRENRDKQWKPQVDPQNIQERLNLIALADYQTLDTKGTELLSTVVSFGEKNQWEGAFDGKYFFWKTGNFAGKGFQVKAQHVKKFEAGAFAFEDTKLNWCPNRIKKLEVDAGPVKFTLRQQGLMWIVGQKEVDPTYIEQWLGRACSNQLEEYVDTGVAPENKYQYEGTMKAIFTDGKVLSWKKDLNEPAFSDGSRQFLSPQLAKHLSEVTEAPIKGEAPPEVAEPVKPPTNTKKKTN